MNSPEAVRNGRDIIDVAPAERRTIEFEADADSRYVDRPVSELPKDLLTLE